MRYEIAASVRWPGHWHVEAIDSDGGVLVVIFSGANARERAQEYADCKNSEVKPSEQVIQEKEELHKKIDKLSVFIFERPSYRNLPIEEQLRLNQQLRVMSEYLQILVERLKAFGEKQPSAPKHSPPFVSGSGG